LTELWYWIESLFLSQEELDRLAAEKKLTERRAQDEAAAKAYLEA